MLYRHTLAATCLVLFFSSVSAKQCSGTQEYTYRLDATFGPDTNRFFPTGPDVTVAFSPVVGATHNRHFSMWRPGAKASRGVQDVAESGATDSLREILAEAGFASTTILGGPLPGPPGTQSVTFTADPSNTKLSLVSMIFPSPDWFVGIYDVELCNTRTGKWKDQPFSGPARSYDSGTDSGTTFLADDIVTSPQEPISLVTDRPLRGARNRVGTITVRKSEPQTQPRDGVACTGTQQYTYQLRSTFGPQNNPYFPDNAAFSPVVGATHDGSFTMWAPGSLASRGVQDVAESGATDSLVRILAEAGFASSTIQGGPLPLSGAVGTQTVTFTARYPNTKLSLVSMVFPSPDWFVGVRDVELCDTSTGRWIDEPVSGAPARSYDSGTDSGTSFLAADRVTSPPQPIALVTDRPLAGDLNQVGTFRVTKGEVVCSSLDLASLDAGTVVSRLDGVQVHATRSGSSLSSENRAMVFDSAHPTGGDTDLGAPNRDFGGPGVGSGGRSGRAGENSRELGNVLIISEDLDSRDPDDNGRGGTMVLTFDTPVALERVTLLDIDEQHGVHIDAYNSANNHLMRTTSPGLGNNGVESLNLDLEDVKKLQLYFPGSGALARLSFCRSV